MRLWALSLTELKLKSVRPGEYEYSSRHPIRVVLTIAHLDHDEFNHAVKLDRLASLCQRCHLIYDDKEKRRRKKEKSL